MSRTDPLEAQQKKSIEQSVFKCGGIKCLWEWFIWPERMFNKADDHAQMNDADDAEWNFW